MKLQFDSSQAYQLDAVQAIIDIFEGQPIAKGSFEVSFSLSEAGLALTQNGIANQLLITDNQILSNIKRVQTQFNAKNKYVSADGVERYLAFIEPSESLETTTAEEDNETLTPLNFTVEMETGTGKTYTLSLIHI